MGEKLFFYNTLLDEGQICNQQVERENLWKGVENGSKLLVYGKRNTGKTSIVRNVIAKRWLMEHKDGFYFYVDLMGVKTLANISERMTLAFSEAYNRSFKMKSLFQSMLSILKKLRPTLELDDQGSPQLSLSFSPVQASMHFVEIIRHIKLLSQKVKSLLVFDEFQDIHGTAEADALLRGELQNLDPETPVIIIGSKQHLLANLFARPKAPFASWGTHIHFQPIPYDDYHDYMEIRFKKTNLSISYENA
ncbi:MAG: ATP-binding protein, partial [Oligoflexales bacterium]|nr:ATP-binding protein [Oligoflexales bacterium]